MKFGINDLKKLIKEMMTEQITEATVAHEELVGGEETPPEELETLTSYESESLSLLNTTNKLLSELLTQMKTITYFSTPGRTPAEASLEKTMAGAIQEKKKKE